jgi:hypothetical protein
MELRSGRRFRDAYDAPPSPPALGAAVYTAAMGDAPPPPPARGGFALDPDADSPSVSGVPPPPAVGGGTFSLPPVILRVLPLRGSSAPVGFIYDATPDPVDGGLLAAASAFFSHQGHQVFHDQCPDLDEYCRASGVSLASVVPVDRLPDYLLSSGLEIMAVLRSPSPTDTTVGGMTFMAAYLSSSASGPPLVGASAGPSVGVLPLVVPPVPSSARFTGGSSAASAWLSAPPPASSVGGYAILGGPPFPVSGGPVDPGGSPPPRHSSSSVFMGGSVLPSSTPVRNPYVTSSRHTDPGGFRGGFLS